MHPSLPRGTASLHDVDANSLVMPSGNACQTDEIGALASRVLSTKRPLEDTHPKNIPGSNQHLAGVLIICGAIGTCLGLFLHPTWHDAVEPGQVLAGLVRYPAGGVAYSIEIRPWTILNQLTAAMLFCGLSERVVTLTLSGLVGALSLQAIGLFVLALTENPALAVSCPTLVYLSDAAAGGVTYPSMLMGTSATYGVVGLSLLLMMLALFALDRPRAACFLLGLDCAVHPPTGVWAIAVVLGSLAWDRRIASRWATSASRSLAIGVTIASGSACLQIALTGGNWPAFPTYESTAATIQFIRFWDDHRRPFPLVSGSMALVLLTTGFAGLELVRPIRPDSPSRRFLFRAFILAIALGGALSVSYWLTDPLLVLLQLMPSRLLNLALLTCLPLIVTGLWMLERDIVAQVLLGVLVLGLCISPSHRTGLEMRWIGSAAVLLTASGRTIWAATRPLERRLLRGLRLAIVLAPIVGLVSVSLRSATVDRNAIWDGGSDRALAAAIGRPGVLLTGGRLRFIQARTRRPVLLDGGYLDMFIYTPDLIPEADRLLNQVYGINVRRLANDVILGHPGDTLLATIGRDLWARRSASEWHQIASRFGVTDVVTDADWVVQLPIVARSERYALYTIPSVASE